MMKQAIFKTVLISLAIIGAETIVHLILKGKVC